MTRMSSRWGVLIRGDPTSLESLYRKVNGSVKKTDDFFISRAGSEHILRSSRWDAAADATTALQLASESVSVILGCLDILERRSGLSIFSTLEFVSDGTVNQWARMTHTLPRNAKAEASPGSFKRLILAAASPDLAGAISDFQGDGDWYSLYKVFEGLRRHYGNENHLFAAFPAKKAELVRLRRTANSYRHSEKEFAPVANPIGLNAAKALLESIFEAIADGQPYPNSSFARGEVQVVDYPSLPLIWITPANTG